MKCGVRFCGGCNSRFDRGEAYEKIRTQLKDEIEFDYAKEDDLYDVILVIGGCTNCCASYDQYRTKRGVVKVYDSEDVDKTIQILKDFE
jgi:hypothetical protein